MKDVLEWVDSRKPGVTETEINRAEEQLGIRLPAEYKELFTLTNNAQVDEWTFFPIKDPANLKKTWDDLVRQNNELRDEGMPEDLIAIAEDETGDLLCYRRTEEGIDERVYLWDHETGEREELASGLREFILSYEALEKDWEAEALD
ncbi:hypothetical protein AC622_11310 [Bacillus sp. FJAT-27916]|uniref:SMI1/KNR4 family protein n=1 Tax=Bacillus sp. FJAT-27916 TaxID=1679169 RepID=UPI000670FBEF|nr:SMI1/KNR4 family protein [Bacillus sp. FJAT-27916]KMY44740.1 hypothetical protein AC622_11310 [Bacillus sp. FJAT-27916]